MLADFGLSKLVHETPELAVNFSSPMGSLRAAGAIPWMAPELLADEEDPDIHLTKETDVYALGMLIIELYTGKAPFNGQIKSPKIADAVIHGRRPHRPRELYGFNDCLWELARGCWQEDPTLRPSIAAISGSLDTEVERRQRR